MLMSRLYKRDIFMSILNGVLIRQLREQKGWDQRELARIAQIHPSVLSRLEREVQQDVRLSVVVAVASALNVPITSLIRENKDLLISSQALIPDLQNSIAILAEQSEGVQKQAAGILKGYLSTIEIV
jgi:transcriptional regulator with XRE-family HTH domain